MIQYLHGIIRIYVHMVSSHTCTYIRILTHILWVKIVCMIIVHCMKFYSVFNGIDLFCHNLYKFCAKFDSTYATNAGEFSQANYEQIAIYKITTY